MSTPDTLAPVTRSWRLLSRYQASARAVNGTRTSVLLHFMHAPPARSHPSGIVPVWRITGIR
jgi:hypothetical protein